MAKADTVKKYIDDFLAGKSPEKREKFLSRSIDRQYQSIMTWRYQQRRKTMDAEREDFIGLLRDFRRRLERVEEMSDDRINEIGAELDSLKAFLVDFQGECRKREIRRLRQQELEIQARLRALEQ